MEANFWKNVSLIEKLSKRLSEVVGIIWRVFFLFDVLSKHFLYLAGRGKVEYLLRMMKIEDYT